MKNNKKKGFTLMELLIVIAIIVVLIAIAIPVLTGQLEKAREATDAANIRSAYAECAVAALSETSAGTVGDVTVTVDSTTKTVTAKKSVVLTQTVADWTKIDSTTKVGGAVALSTVPSSGTVEVSVDSAGTVTIGAAATSN